MKTTTAFYATPQTREDRIKSSGLPVHRASDARSSCIAKSEAEALRFAARLAHDHDVDMQVWQLTAPAESFTREGRKVVGIAEAISAGSITLVRDVTSVDADELIDQLAAA